MASALDPNREKVRLALDLQARLARRKAERLASRSPAARKGALTKQHNAYARDPLLNARVEV